MLWKNKHESNQISIEKIIDKVGKNIILKIKWYFEKLQYVFKKQQTLQIIIEHIFFGNPRV